MTAAEASNQLANMSLNDKDQSTIGKPIDDQEEEILKENPKRFCLFPIKYHEVSR